MCGDVYSSRMGPNLVCAHDLDQTLSKLQQHELPTSVEMSGFSLEELELLGYVLSGNGVRPGPKKTQAIRERKVPQTHKSELVIYAQVGRTMRRGTRRAQKVVVVGGYA